MAIKSLTRKHDNNKKGEDVLRNGKQQETDMSVDKVDVKAEQSLGFPTTQRKKTLTKCRDRAYLLLKYSYAEIRNKTPYY